MISLNEEYAVKEFAPYLVLIGSNGGEEVYAFDTRRTDLPIVVTPFTGIGIEEKLIAHSFAEFIENSFNPAFDDY